MKTDDCNQSAADFPKLHPVASAEVEAALCMVNEAEGALMLGKPHHALPLIMAAKEKLERIVDPDPRPVSSPASGC